MIQKELCRSLFKWQAAAEAEAATMSMVRRAIPDASSLHEVNEIVHGNWLRTIDEHHQQYSSNSTIKNILDVGCSVGVSTRFLADKFPLVPRIISCNKTHLSIINTDFVSSTPMLELCFFYGENFCSKSCIESIFIVDIMSF